MIGARVVTHSVVLAHPRTARWKRRGVKPRSNLTDRLVRLADMNLSGSNGVKHRQPVGRTPTARRGIPVWPGQIRSGWIARFDDDRDLTAIKVALIGIAVLIAMALEVPW